MPKYFTSNDPRINRSGAPTKEELVLEWYRNNPTGSVRKCAKDLKISETTVRKWKPAQDSLKVSNSNSRNFKKPKFKKIINLFKSIL